MEVLKKVAGGMRSGFVLPFSLIMTFIVLIMIGAAANYCTQTMRASEIYLLRSRARMAAQSTIEQAKLVIRNSCDDNQQGIADEGDAGFDQAIANFVVGKIKDSERMTRFLDEMRWSEAYRGDSDTTVTLGTRSDTANGVHAIYATAEVRGSGVKAAVTLEEDIRVLRQAANIFHYAYFANGDGHLIGLGSGTSQRLTVNGDVRANGDFYLSGVNVNGFVYSQKEAKLADETDGTLKAWWNERYVTTRTADSYNSNFRTVNTRHNIKTKYDCRVRPTDPISTGIPWEGGFRGAHDYTKDKSGSWLERLLRAIFEVIRRALQDGNKYDDGEIAITKDVKAKVETELDEYEAEPKGQIVKEKVSKLPMPRIVADEEPETDNDKHLKFYREGYAATARTPKGKTGGSLICSNAYLNASGEAKQLSARIRLEKPAWTEPAWSETVQDVVHHGEETKPGEIIRAGSRVVEALQPNSLLVYGCLTADEYRAKVVASPDEKDKWYQLRGDHSNADDGPVGAFASGFAGTVPAGQAHAGDKLFFDKKSFDDLLRTNFNLRADNVRAKFNEDSWREVNATYKSETRKRGARVISEDSVKQYRYSSGYEFLWTSVGDGYLVGSGNYVAGSEVRSILSDYTKYSGITETAVLNALLGSGWKTCKSGYIAQLLSIGLPSLDVQLIEYYDNGKTERYEVRSGSNFKDWEESYSTYQYNGVYYSAEPVGMIEINTNEYDAAKITITFNPIEKSTATKTTNTYRKILETKLVRLYSKSSSGTKVSGTWYGNSRSGSSFNKKCCKKADIDTQASYFGDKYDAALESQIKAYFAGGNDGWSNYSSRYSGTSGWLAIRVIGIFSDESREMDFDVEYDYLSSEDKKYDLQDNEKILDVYSVPVYSYESSYSDRLGENWYRITSSDGFNGKVINRGEDVRAAAEYFDGKYGLTEDDVLNTVNNFFSQTNRRWSQQTRGRRSTLPSGYLVVKVLWETNAGKVSHKLVCEYSKEERKGYDLDIESVKESETTYLGKVPNDCIPVYDYIDDRTYQGKSSWAKQYWQAATGENGCRSDKAHGFFRMRDLNRIAELKKDARLSLTADGVKEVIVDQEDATGYTWSTANNFAYHLSANPKGYIDIRVDPEHVIEISYNHLAVASGEIRGPETVTPAWDEEVERKVEHPEVNHPAETKTVTRELRGIFVKQGYKIIVDDSFIPPDWTNPLHVDPEDLKLWNGHPLTASSTTADLRPFREDGEFKCNEATDNGDKAADKGAVILIGTWDFPILIDGPVVFESDVLIRGFVTGNGTIYSGRNIHIIGDIHYKNAPYWPYDGGALPDTKGKDLLRLVARGSIVIGNYARNPVTGQCVDEVWGKLLSENYINGLRNSHDGMGDNNYRYVQKDYTDYDRTGGGIYKIKYDHTLKKLNREQAKCYESVVGDYVFLSMNDQADAKKPASGLSGVNAPGCDCRLSQQWDFNFGVDEYRTAVGEERALECASYQSTVIQDYVNKNAWSLSERIGTAAIPGRSFWDYLWKQKGLDFRNFARDNYYPKSETSPRLNALQHIDAVLYACEGLYGAMGEQSTPCVINGAVIANEEALLPFVRMRRTLFGASRAEGHSFTINWDIRLNRQSEDAQRNMEYDGDIFKQPMWGSSEDSTDIGEMIRLHWMQVPNDRNPEYNATP